MKMLGEIRIGGSAFCCAARPFAKSIELRASDSLSLRVCRDNRKASLDRNATRRNTAKELRLMRLTCRPTSDFTESFFLLIRHLAA